MARQCHELGDILIAVGDCVYAMDFAVCSSTTR